MIQYLYEKTSQKYQLLAAVHFHPMPAAKPMLPSKVDRFQSYITEPAHSLSQGSECDLHADHIYQAGLQDEESTMQGQA